MAHLIFKYGAMNCGKSLQLIALAYSYKQRGLNFITLKSTRDTRSTTISSRALNTHLDCIPITADDSILETVHIADDVKFILVDECQFMTPRQIDELAIIADRRNITVICYGLRTDFRTQLFEGSKRLFEIADSFEELKSMCSCGNKASVNARIGSDNKIITEGPQIECGSEDKYVTLCRNCYRNMIDNQ